MSRSHRHSPTLKKRSRHNGSVVSTCSESGSSTSVLSKRKHQPLDSPATITEKCRRLAKMLRSAKHAVVYTGAGMSTAASIPDYRGPEGVWTLASKGLPVQPCDPAKAEPTLAHIAVRELYRNSLIHHVVSQNCDGLHLRSGVPQKALSEIHGNMYIEVCTKCSPLRQFVRRFDVTGATRFRRHKTGRKCDVCGAELLDTIVHFGERGKFRWPLNWEGAIAAARNADLILCLGSSLQILKKYTFLWTGAKLSRKAKLCIVNLEWTPKDRSAALKINGRCDEVLSLLMKQLELPLQKYCRVCDPLFDPTRRDSITTMDAQRRHSALRNGECKLASEVSTCSCIDEDDLPLRVLLDRAAETERRERVLAADPHFDERLSRLRRSLETWEKYRRGAVGVAGPPLLERRDSSASSSSTATGSGPTPGWWAHGISAVRRKGMPMSALARKRRRLAGTEESSGGSV